VSWPTGISWEDAPAPQIRSLKPSDLLAAWPADFEDRYRSDVLTLAGEQEAVFPASGETLRFVRKSSADPANQLLDVARFLEQRYTALGVQTRRQSFVWRGIPQANLIAVLPGNAADHALKPVLMADHYDTAFCEDTFAKTKERVSAPGADDNDTAAATLLSAAALLRDTPHARDIWLVHLTGEEFPGDDLGARQLVSQFLREGQDIGGLVLMDMIGWHKSGDGLFQISAGDSAASLRIAAIAQGSALELAPRTMIPVVRSRFDDRSYIYNTDGLIFSDSGYPVILLNEHLNYLENLNRAGYHQTTDTSTKVDFGFASAIARVAIQTALSLSNAE
jgi:Zn-dependent M28 family amino/carboxypeptidase